VQQLAMTTGTPSTGTFTLRFGTGGTNTTGNLSCTATTDQVQTALQALTTVGANNIYVSRPALGTYKFYFAGTLTGNVGAISNPARTCKNTSNTNMTLTLTTPYSGATETMSLGYLSNSGTYAASVTGGTCATSCILPARFAISSVTASNSNKTVTITLGANAGSNVPTVPTGTWTLVPSPAASKTTSATGALSLCTTNPVGFPSTGLCQPTAPAGW